MNDTIEYANSDGKIVLTTQCEIISNNFHIISQNTEKIIKKLFLGIKMKPQIQGKKDRFDEYEYEYEDTTENFIKSSVSLQDEISKQSVETNDATADKKIVKTKLKSTFILMIITLLLICLYLIRKYNILSILINLFRFKLL